MHTLEILKDHIQKLPQKVRDEPERTMLSAYYALSILFNMYSGNYKRGLEGLPKVEKWLTENLYYHNKAELIVMQLGIAIIYIGNNKYRQALKWVNRILDNRELDGIRKDVHGFVRIVNIIVHYKLGNDSLLPGQIKSTYRYLLTKSSLFKVEKAVLEFLSKNRSKIKSQRERIKLFKLLRDELDEIMSDPVEAKAKGYFDISAWLSSEIEGKSMEDVVKLSFKNLVLKK